MQIKRDKLHPFNYFKVILITLLYVNLTQKSFYLILTKIALVIAGFQGGNVLQSNQTWKITFRGEVLPGLNKDMVKKDCVQMLKLPADKVDRMFSGRDITLRKGLNQERLNKYITFFHRCGLHVHAVEEKDKLTLIDDSKPGVVKANSNPIPEPLGLRPPETDNSGDELFAHQTIISTFHGHQEFYDALIRKNDGSEVIFDARGASPTSLNTQNKAIAQSRAPKNDAFFGGSPASRTPRTDYAPKHNKTIQHTSNNTTFYLIISVVIALVVGAALMIFLK